MHIDTVVLYVYQYCRSIDTNVITIDTGNVITIHIKTADIVILVTISSHCTIKRQVSQLMVM